VNRLLTEGRRAFLRRVSGIERGADCARHEPLLSGLADGEASPEELAQLRPHMRTCLSCRAALREFRAMPGRVASVVPPVALASGDGGGPLRCLLESALGAAQHKTAAVGERVHAAAELATGQKIAAVAASAAALAGGGTAIDELTNHRQLPQAAQMEQQDREQKPPEQTETPTDPPPPPPPPPPSNAPPASDPEPAPPPAQPEPTPPPPDPATEFAPTGAPQPTPAAPPPASPPPDGSISLAGNGGSSSAGSGEFAP
jgi:Putative zinc-finger